MATEEQLANLGNAESRMERANRDVGKIRGNAGGWKAEGTYRAESGRLYEAIVAAGGNLTKRKPNGSYYFCGEYPRADT